MAKIFEDDYSIKYVIIKVKQEMVEERGRYNATRIAWKMKLETIKQYPYVLSVTEGIVKAVYKVDVWKMAGEVGEPDRVMFEGTEVKDEEITKKFVGKMIPECYRKKGQASPVLYQKREGEADTEDEVAASAPKAEKPAASSSESAEQNVSVVKFEAVDLGLPSGIKWANMNIGAKTPDEVGSRLAWGETEPKEDYSWKTYKHCDGTKEGFTYKKSLHGFLDLVDDVAYKTIGEDWRMPSLADFKELRDKCEWQRIKSDEKEGFIIKGPNGKSIFLPETDFGYWSRVRFDDSAYVLLPWDSDSFNGYQCYRGLYVRPVCIAKDREAEVADSAEQKAYSAKFEAVDLGLPSGTKWANMNIGAENPFHGGDFFAWGEIEPKKEYTWETYKYGDNTEEGCKKYYYLCDNYEKLDPTDDVAHIMMGGKWRMPTSEEYRELIDKCEWQWLKTDDKAGYIVKGPNGKSIFLPAAGRFGDSDSVGFIADYWSSSFDSSCQSLRWEADRLVFYLPISTIEVLQKVYAGDRSEGCQIRPVCD